MKVWMLAFGALLLTVGSLAADQPLSVQAPTVMLAPGHLVVETLIDPDPSNKTIRVTAESPEQYRSSEVVLDGGAAPRRNTFEFRDLPTGIYQIRALLLDANGDQRAAVVKTVEVIARPRRS
jgi:hypothetical protein